MTHSDLIERAAKWLRQGHAVVITEMGGSEKADAIGFMAYGGTTLIECKTSRADFLADQKKYCRRFAKNGIGSHRYYLTPLGLLSIDEIPNAWGLLEVHGRQIHCLLKSAHFPELNFNQEQQILISLIRRIGQQQPQGVSIKFYTYQTGNTATCGVKDVKGED